MRRFVGETLEAFESLFGAAATGAGSLERAEYPPACDPPFGPLLWRHAAAGGVIVEVDPRALRCDDFRLEVLFGVGSCVFSRPSDLRAFWNGPLAAAFGIEVEADPHQEPEPTPSDDLRLQFPDPPVAATATASPPKPARPKRTFAPSPAELAAELSRRVYGQDAALARVATVVAAQLAKRKPARPATICLIGPTGVGKTATIEALPAALTATGYGNTAVHRVDCGELTARGDVTRILGCGPGYLGYDDTPPLYRALRKPGCILLLDEFEKAHEELHSVVLALLDTGRIRTPPGKEVDGSGAIVALTSNAAPDELEALLHTVDPANTQAIDRIGRHHLREHGWPPELVGRISAVAAYGRLGETTLRAAAEQAIHEHAAEYGFEVVAVAPVLAEVVVDLAARGGAGARGLHHAARDLLGETLAQAVRHGIIGHIELTPGPPPGVIPR